MLQSLPQGAKFGIVYDGRARIPVSAIWLARSGMVLFGSADGAVYDDNDRPDGAPSERDHPYYKPKEARKNT